MSSFSAARSDDGISLKGLSADLFSERFSLVFKTYWQCSLVPWFQTGNFPNNVSALNADPVNNFETTFNTTTTTVTTFTDICLSQNLGRHLVPRFKRTPSLRDLRCNCLTHDPWSHNPRIREHYDEG